MNRSIPALVLLWIVGCTPAPDADAPTTRTTPAEPAISAPPAAKAARSATATGVVQSVDAIARTVTIAHGPVEALGWPGMTMTFQAPNSDLSAIKAGDGVAFEFMSSGMDGKIVTISKRQPSAEPQSLPADPSP